MPELPDITLYLEALDARVRGTQLEAIELRNPFLLRTVEPAPQALAGRTVCTLRRLGKRIALGLSGDYWLVLHLMIAGRLHWAPAPARKAAGRNILAVLRFSSGLLSITEAGSKRRAALHLVHGEAQLAPHAPAGLEIAAATPAEFAARLRLRNHTLKRALTDPQLYSGIGNAYSDEILHAAGLSPLAMSQKLTAAEVARLHRACSTVLETWTSRLRAQAGGEFPSKVTAFRPEMAVHGRFGQSCPVCATPVQRIRYADNETNYCPRCQTGGRVLADRALSRLLKRDWPRTIDEL